MATKIYLLSAFLLLLFVLASSDPSPSAVPSRAPAPSPKAASPTSSGSGSTGSPKASPGPALKVDDDVSPAASNEGSSPISNDTPGDDNSKEEGETSDAPAAGTLIHIVFASVVFTVFVLA